MIYPFMLVLYRFIRGAGYSVVSTQDFPFGEVTKGNLLEALKDLEASGEVLANLPKPPKPFLAFMMRLNRLRFCLIGCCRLRHDSEF